MIKGRDISELKRVNLRQLSELWNVTQERVRQFIKSGRLVRGDDGLVDLDDALVFRAVAVSENVARTLFQTYANEHGEYQSKILSMYENDAGPSGEAKTDDPYGDITNEEALGLPPLPKTVKAPVAEREKVLSAAVAQTTKLTDLRAREVEQRMLRAQLKEQRERGELMPRNDVAKSAKNASAEITMLLNTLPHEMANLFDDQDMRSDARRKAEQVVKRCLFALHKKMKAMAHDDFTQDEG